MGQRRNFDVLNNEDFAKFISRDSVQLVDVRSGGEYAEGHIPNALNIDVMSADFDKKAKQLDKTKPVAVYCRSGKRSKVAAERLSEMGYKVSDLDTGVINWNGAITK